MKIVQDDTRGRMRADYPSVAEIFADLSVRAGRQHRKRLVHRRQQSPQR